MRDGELGLRCAMGWGWVGFRRDAPPGRRVALGAPKPGAGGCFGVGWGPRVLPRHPEQGHSVGLLGYNGAT